MKAIIYNLLFDTDKSECLGFYRDNNRYYKLYRTSNDNLFIVDLVMNDFIVVREEVHRLIGFYFPDQYVELFGEAEEA